VERLSLVTLSDRWLTILVVAGLACGEPRTVERALPVGRELPPLSAEPFLDVTSAAGIDFVHSSGDATMDNIIESLGSGAAWLDVDGDRDLDLYLVNQRWLEGVSSPPRVPVAPGNRLYRNRGDGTFDDVTDAAGVSDGGFGYSAAAADFDNDGDQDLYVANCGVNSLYRNRGDGTFDEIGAQAGVADERCSAGATFLDFDGDGLLDLYVANYLTYDSAYQIHYAPDVYPGPLAYEAEPDSLYRNRGDGTFENVTERWGIDVTPGRAMGVVATDFDGDLVPDLFVANDGTENFLFRNSGAGAEEIAVPSGVAFGFRGEATGAMAGSVGDFDLDGLPDILVTDTSYGSLYRNSGQGLFEDRVMSSQLATPSGQWVSWGGGFFDYDNDGDLDILQVNGDLKRATGRPDLLLANRGDGTFEVADGGSYFARELPGRGGCFADFDRDGDLDVLVTNLGSAPVLLRNDQGHRNHWVEVTLEGRRSNRDGLGARVSVAAGGRRQVQVRHAASGFLTQSQPALHFGLGSAATIDRLSIEWPSGERQELEGLAVDQPYRVVEGVGIE